MRQLKATAGATLLVLACSSLPCRGQDLAPARDPEPARSFDTRGMFDVPRDDRRTLSAFPKNLGRNFVGVFSGQNLLPFAVGVGATTLASAFDYRTKDMLMGSCETCGKTGATLRRRRGHPGCRRAASWPAASRRKGTSARRPTTSRRR